ncbi:MAG: LPXTG cell wall anchor domain-containing protein [Bacillota bacterium]
MRNRIIGFGLAAVLLALLCAPMASAFPSYATSVIVYGATLTSLSPYWKNGGGGDASDWNLFFDTSTAAPTLKMKNAVLGTLNASRYLVQANGDIVVELDGNNVLTYNGTMPGAIVGLGSSGSILIRDGAGGGTGSLSIAIVHSWPSSNTIGISVYGDELLIDSGIIDVSVYDSHQAVALYSFDNINVRGGNLAALAWGDGNLVCTIACYMFRQSGGTVASTVNGTDVETTALFFSKAQFTGGYGLFSAVEIGFGALWDTPFPGEFYFTGGHVVFSGGDCALRFNTDSLINPDVAGDVYVSEFPSGLDKFLWNSTMDPLAANNSVPAVYGYVEMIGLASVPQTGDESVPWVWFFSGLLAAVCAAGVFLVLRRRRA